MAFVGFAPAFQQAFQQGQRARQQGQLQEQQAEQRLAELQKRFELEASLPTAQQRQAQAFATDPNVRRLLEFQADPLGLKSRQLDIQEKGLEGRIRDLTTPQQKNYEFLVGQGLSPEQALANIFPKSDVNRPTSQQRNFEFLTNKLIQDQERTLGRKLNNEELQNITDTASQLSFRSLF